jgi:phosphatidylglycerol:prolipoprotein diacylglycerol transferase
MIYDIVIFGIHLKINPIAFTLPIGPNGWSVYWYGIILATGFLLAMIYGLKNAKRLGINPDKMIDAVLIVTPISIICARTYYVLFDGVKCKSIADFFGFGSSSGLAGIAIYGGVIGAFVSGYIICKLFKIKVANMFDLTALGFLIGQCVGRWGNFVNQEAYGDFTGSSFWGMQSNATISEMGEGLVHPCFLYESIWCFIGFLLIHKLSKNRRFSGECFLMYCAWYGFGRGFIEILRTDSLMIGNIKVSCLVAFTLCVASIILIAVLRKKNKPEAEYTAVFSENMENENVQDN